MSKQLSPEEKKWLLDLAPPLVRLIAGLSLAAQSHKPGRSDAIAVAATIAFVKDITGSTEGLAPLREALEVIEATIDPIDLPACRRWQAIVSDIHAIKSRETLPQIKDFVGLERLSNSVVVKVLGTVAVEYQLRNGVQLNRALKNVVGNDVDAAKKLEKL